MSKAARSIRAWWVPLSCACLGLWGWACQDADDGNTGASTADGGDDDADDGDDGEPDGDGDGAIDSGDGTAGPQNVDRDDVLRSIALEVIVPRSAGFAQVSTELRAAIEALKALKRPCTVDLTTDSEYVKNGITTWLENWKPRMPRQRRRRSCLLNLRRTWRIWTSSRTNGPRTTAASQVKTRPHVTRLSSSPKCNARSLSSASFISWPGRSCATRRARCCSQRSAGDSTPRRRRASSRGGCGRPCQAAAGPPRGGRQ